MLLRNLPAALLLMGVATAHADLIIAPAIQTDTAGSSLDLEITGFGAGKSMYLIYDLSATQAWTSAENQALVNNLFHLITTLGGDPAQIAQLFQPGAVFAEPDLLVTLSAPPGVSFAQAVSPVVVTSSAQTASPVPEPATMELLGAALVALGSYAAIRLRTSKTDGAL